MIVAWQRYPVCYQSMILIRVQYRKINYLLISLYIEILYYVMLIKMDDVGTSYVISRRYVLIGESIRHYASICAWYPHKDLRT